MKIENELHQVQASILQALLIHPELKFSEFDMQGLSSDHFTFHLKRLLELGFIKKGQKGGYSLSNRGKEFANRFDAGTNKPVRQAKLGSMTICVREKGEETEVLFSKRLKQPYYGYHGFVSGKMKWGETPIETSKRELLEEVNVTGDFKFAGIEHKMDYSKDGDLLEDKYFFVVKVTNLKGKLIEKFSEGENIWVKKSEIKDLKNKFPDIDILIDLAFSKSFKYVENKFIVEGY